MKKRNWSKAETEMVSFGSIEIGERRREKLGPIAALANSIERNGLIHPLVINQDDLLVAGRRRLAALERLGWRQIPVRRFERMSPEELRELELDENSQRLDLNDYEASKKRLADLEEAKAELEEVSAQIAQKPSPKGGRPKGGDSAVAEATGLSRDEIRRTRKHVEVAEEFPIFQGKAWKRSQVIAAGEALEKIPKRDQAVAIEMVSGPGVDTKSAVKILDSIGEKPSADRKEILKLWKSDDPAEKSLAVTRAVKLPPMPPKVLFDLDLAIKWSDKAATRKTARASQYATISKKLRALREEESKQFERFKAAEGWS